MSVCLSPISRLTRSSSSAHPHSTTATPRKHPGGNDDEISSKNKAQVVVPTSSRNTSRTVAESSTKGVNGGTGLNGQADSNGNGSSKSINGFSPARNSPRTGKDGGDFDSIQCDCIPGFFISAAAVAHSTHTAAALFVLKSES